MKKKALLIIDMQEDFCEDGALPVPNARQIIPLLNQAIKAYEKQKGIVIFTRDWHSLNNRSFKSNGGIWPNHCVANTKGAAFHKDLYFPSVFSIVNKGMDDKDFGYSAFTNTALESFLRNANINELYLGGLVLEYCVLNTAIHAAQKGFKVNIFKDLTKSLKNSADEIAEVFQQLEKEGIKII